MDKVFLVITGCLSVLAAAAAKDGHCDLASLAASFAAAGVAVILISQGVSQLRKR